MKLKQLPEDFLVEEVLSKKPTGSGSYIWFTLEKRNRNLFDVIDEISKQLRIPRDRIGYAGLKDKVAVTKQTLSVYGVNVSELKKLKIDGAKLSGFKKSSQPILLGDLVENKFRIVARDIDKNKQNMISKNVKSINDEGVLNLFDDQRFGSNKNTHIIGKLILKKEWEMAVKLFVRGDSSRWGKSISNYLNRNPEDYLGALRTLPKTLQMLFVNAYQSYLFNQIALMCKPKKTTKLPIIGYETVLENYPEVYGITDKILKKEKVRLENFRVKGLPIKPTGDERSLLAFPRNLNYKIEKDELSKDKIKATFEFSLQKGSYGTQVVKEIFTR
ncbi:MAG TPA: tRNA pseudouridine(13) synthase TruD [archaeon]|nr:tRNA pseudouridine(13) synthase TruD [archaeon]